MALPLQASQASRYAFLCFPSPGVIALLLSRKEGIYLRARNASYPFVSRRAWELHKQLLNDSIITQGQTRNHSLYELLFCQDLGSVDSMARRCQS